MCSLDYESITNPQKIDETKKNIQDTLNQEEFTKVMEGPGGYIVDKRNIEIQLKTVV